MADASTDTPDAPAPEPEMVHGHPVTYSRDQRVVHVPRDGCSTRWPRLSLSGTPCMVDGSGATTSGSAVSDIATDFPE